MSSIFKLHIRLSYNTVNVIYRFIQTYDVILCYENHKIVTQITKVLTLFEHICINHTGEISGSLRIRSAIVPLNLYIVFIS